MKIFAILSLFVGYFSFVTCLPQSVQERNFRFEQVDDSVRLPYIGGAKGQVLEIRQRPDGTIFSRILTDEPKNDIRRQTEYDPFQNTRQLADLASQREENNFEMSLASIQEAAQELVNLQEIYKEQGRLTTEQKRIYSHSLERLGVSAQKLANSQGTDEEIKLLLEQPAGEKTKEPSKKKQTENHRFPPYNHKKPGQQKKTDEDCEESGPVGEEGSDLTTSSVKPPTTSRTTSTTTTTRKPTAIVVNSSNSVTANDAISSDGEDPESSVAEAKPTGLAIAGVGGVASSKPVGTAVVGPGGLAVARPVATAIAGLKPGEFGQLGLSLPTKIKSVQYRGSAASLPYSGKYGIVSYGNYDDEEPTRLLVGPEFLSQARLADKGIESDEEEYNGGEKVENENTNNNNDAQETETLKRPNVFAEEEREGDKNNFEESPENPPSPYGIPNFGKYPLFPVAYDRFNYQTNPYFLPPNSYAPIPLVNQYLQRRSYNAGLRYPQIISPYPQYYGNDHYNPTNTYAPLRYFYAQ